MAELQGGSNNSPNLSNTAKQRSNNKNDPFYVASVYDKEPKGELENLKQYTPFTENKLHNTSSEGRNSRKKPSRIGKSPTNQPVDNSPIPEEDTEPMITVQTKDQTHYGNQTAQLGKSPTNQAVDNSPMPEEDTEPMIAVHTEDQTYFDNDFQQNSISNPRNSPSGLSVFLDGETTGVVGSIRRTLLLLD